jgi:hypothetical protein
MDSSIAVNRLIKGLKSCYNIKGSKYTIYGHDENDYKNAELLCNFFRSGQGFMMETIHSGGESFVMIYDNFIFCPDSIHVTNMETKK